MVNEMLNTGYSIFCPTCIFTYLIATNGRHQWVPKDIIEAAEKHAKVCKCFINYT